MKESKWNSSVCSVYLTAPISKIIQSCVSRGKPFTDFFFLGRQRSIKLEVLSKSSYSLNPESSLLLLFLILLTPLPSLFFSQTCFFSTAFIDIPMSSLISSMWSLSSFFFLAFVFCHFPECLLSCYTLKELLNQKTIPDSVTQSV